MSAWEIDLISASTGLPIGFGPITSGQFFDVETALDKAGAVSFDMPRADTRSDLVTERQIMQCSALRGGTWQTVGRGRVEDLTEDMTPDQVPLLEVGGADDFIALADRTVGSLVLTDNAHAHNENPMLKAAILPAIMAFVSGWTVVGVPSEDTYLAYSNESVLAALGKLASQLGDHFRLDANLTLTWLPKTTLPVASGIRAMGNIPAPSALSSDTCLITHLQRKRDASKQATRVYAYGAGNAGARVDLSGTVSYTLPAGYSYGNDASGYYIKHDAADAANRIDTIHTFNDVAEMDTATGHKLSAKNALAQTAVVWLGRHVDVYYSYELEVTAVSQAILPGQTIRVVHDQYLAGRRIPVVDADLLVLGTKSRLDAEGTARIVSLTVANSDRWPEDDETMAAGQAVSSMTQSSHLQVAQRSLTADSAAAVSDANVALLNAGNVYDAATEQTIGVTDALTSTLANVLTLRHASTGTVADDFGSVFRFRAPTDAGGGVYQSQGSLRASWKTAADATRKGRMVLMVADAASTSREVMRGESSGTTPMFSVLGAAASARITLPAAATDLATALTLVNAIRSLLITFGFAA